METTPVTASASQGRVVVTINGGSSSIKFAVFEIGGILQRIFSGSVERIGLAGAVMNIADAAGREIERRPADAPTPEKAAELVAGVLHERVGRERIAAIGHRVVHGGLHLTEPRVVTEELLAALREAVPLDPAHLPGEMALIEAFRAAFPGILPIVCFDTAFHDGMPRIAKLLPIPRKYLDAGVRRLGFHGLSYTYLMRELERVAGAAAARGKVLLAHLGSGASMAAVCGGRAVDTTMALTPAAGLVMGTRPGDMDPGLLTYLMRTEDLSSAETEEFINRQCGLAGVSGRSSDMRDLLARRESDAPAAEAVELFCYRARQWIGALAASMGGIDTLVFSAGIGERSPEVRAEICAGLEFLGIAIDAARNAAGEAVISTESSPVTVRVIATDEELTIARVVCDILGMPVDNPSHEARV